MRFPTLTAFVLVSCLLAPLAAQAPSADVGRRIRTEIAARSEIMRTLHQLADVYGPRLTGAPSTKAAAEWALETMRRWGVQNTHLEPWDFGHPGWTNEHVSVHLVAPARDSLQARVMAWTPGTDGVVRADAVPLVLPQGVLERDLGAFLRANEARVRGKVVFTGAPVVVAPTLEPEATRYDAARLKELYGLEPSAGGAADADAPRRRLPPMSPLQIARRLDDFLVSAGAAARVIDAGLELGQIGVAANPRYDVSKAVPTVVMRNEDYGRLSRLMADGVAVTLELRIVNATHPEGRTAYNAIAEIPGSDRRDEIVMLGAHLDSWHLATGATDNAVGCAVMMEAMRAITALGLKPRRTIRLALWSGEEQGLLGSQAYVARHFGTAQRPTREHAQLAAYLNLDTGTGRTRAATVYGPPAAAGVLRELFLSFADLGMVGARATTERMVGATDSSSFAAAGLPALNFLQDPIQYFTATHHTNLDTYERVIEEDARSAAIVIAATAYELAMRDEPLPRAGR